MVLSLIIVLTIMLGLYGFKGPTIENLALSEFRANEYDKGQELAAIYCSSCHLLPDLLSLDKATWEIMFCQIWAEG
ncbi:hypothetical protein ES765_17310 [Maribacter sp. ACAM166]|nr:hypothetical protein ES765_17310 [Maribacter sp. ACAM166]